MILTILPKAPGTSRRAKMQEMAGKNTLKLTRSTITLWFLFKISQHPNSVTSIDVRTVCVRNSKWKFSASFLPFRLQRGDWLPVLAVKNGNAGPATKHTHSTGPTRYKTYAQYRSDTLQNIRTVQVRHATKHTHSEDISCEQVQFVNKLLVNKDLLY
jgi:hypothetical protein